IVEIVAGALVAVVRQYGILRFEAHITGKLRRLAVAQIGEDQPDVVAGRVRLGLDLGAEIRPLGRLVGALTGAVVFPPVIETAKLFAFHASKPQWHRTMRTTRADNVGLAARA